jgi:membrane protein required for colicin V production
MSMAAVVLGLLAAIYFYKKGGEFIRERFMPDVNILPEIIAFTALFLILFIAVKIIESLLKNIIEGVKLGGADRVLGIFFGVAEGIVVVSLVLFLLNIQPLFDPAPIFAGSFFANILLPLIAGVGSSGV